MELFDTHCHIHFDDYGLEPEEVIARARDAGVARMLCVGTTPKDSAAGIAFVKSRENMWATIGIHPHEAKEYADNQKALEAFSELAVKPKVVAVGEAGLDYYYNHSPREQQIKMLEFQLDLAQKHKLPMVFHVREAFDDFWAILDAFSGVRGVVHSFTAHPSILKEVLKRDLYVGLNGIMTFTRDEKQLTMATEVPLERLVLETDAPFLTPKPFRGKICEPVHVVETAKFLADLRHEPLHELAARTTQNAKKLFKL